MPQASEVDWEKDYKPLNMKQEAAIARINRRLDASEYQVRARASTGHSVTFYRNGEYANYIVFPNGKVKRGSASHIGRAWFHD